MRLIATPKAVQHDVCLSPRPLWQDVWDNLVPPWLKIGPGVSYQHPGKIEFSDAVIEFDDPPGLGEKIPKIAFNDMTLHGVIPLESLGGDRYRCCVDLVTFGD